MRTCPAPPPPYDEHRSTIYDFEESPSLSSLSFVFDVVVIVGLFTGGHCRCPNKFPNNSNKVLLLQYKVVVGCCGFWLVEFLLSSRAACFDPRRDRRFRVFLKKKKCRANAQNPKSFSNLLSGTGIYDACVSSLLFVSFL